MSRSRKISARLPHAIIDAIEIRRARGEYGHYHNPSEFQTGQNLYTAFFPRVHEFTVAAARMSPKEQDEIHDFALRLAESNVLLASLTDEKPVTAATVLRLAREWPRAQPPARKK